jgi:hypothetical protein
MIHTNWKTRGIQRSGNTFTVMRKGYSRLSVYLEGIIIVAIANTALTGVLLRIPEWQIRIHLIEPS